VLILVSISEWIFIYSKLIALSGWVATPMAKSIMQDEGLMGRALATTPLQKVAQPEDVARQVAVLASPTLSGHVSGVSLMVDGGMEGRLLFPPRTQ
jgi:NAD(P)-dependent dehydrogenase (short-subunit alcohol dehydrogenase family)